MKSNKEIEKLRTEMHKCINKYGITDRRTLEASQKLDRLVAMVQLSNGRVDEYFG